MPPTFAVVLTVFLVAFTPTLAALTGMVATHPDRTAAERAMQRTCSRRFMLLVIIELRAVRL